MNSGECDIADHALIGNCRSAALVSKFGSINWFCLPECHSPAIFAAILDVENGGFFLIQPAEVFESTQHYLENTNVVEALFRTTSGTVTLIDCYVVMEDEIKKALLFPDHEIIRSVECLSGEVKMHYQFFPRKNYGKTLVALKDQGPLGAHFTFKENICILQSTLPEFRCEDGTEKCEGYFSLQQGEQVVFSFSCSTQHPAIIPEITTTSFQRITGTIKYWKNWSAKCNYSGIFKEWVLRSALTLKLLAYAPSGAIIAAPTSSLPEEIGGGRNWDYRYCWLRDASFTIKALIRLGYDDEAHAYMNWILHATRLTWPKLQVVYTVFGESHMKEKICNWLRGYKNSRPVRTGNKAQEQFQLDVYGEVLDAAYAYSSIIKEFDKGTVKFLIGLGKQICKRWNKPDEGIWEIRSAPVHHTHSKVMAWVGLDRLMKLCQKFKWKDVPLELFKNTSDELRSAIETHGYDHDLASYTRTFNGKGADASLLVLPLVGYCDASSVKMRSTIQHLQEKLLKNGFMYRHIDTEDGLQGKEGAFVACNFWLIETFAKAGHFDQGMNLFSQTIKHSNVLRLFSEEIEPLTKVFLGNYPQGFSHIGLINAACTLNDIKNRRPADECR